LPLRNPPFASFPKTANVLAAFFIASGILSAQSAPTPGPSNSASTLERVENTDPDSGIHYVRFSISIPVVPDQPLPPRFTMECRDNHGKRELEWFVGFGGAHDTGFIPPFHPTPAVPNPPKHPRVKLKMNYEGYIKWKPVTYVWEQMPSGEFHYLNAGMHSPNMPSARYFILNLSSLPGLRIGYEKPAQGDPLEMLFPTQPILDELKKTPTCAP
jgi:hypothetical protein